MSSGEPVMHSFIVRLWLEDGNETERITNWHGQVTHIPGGESRYFRNLDDLVDIIISYLGYARRRRRSWVGRIFRWCLRLS